VFERLRKGLHSIMDRVSKTELREEKLEPILQDLRLVLLENDVAYSVAESLCETVKASLVGVEVTRFGNVKNLAVESLREALAKALDQGDRIDLLQAAAAKRTKEAPLVVVFVGVNGSGKTTTVAKVAHLLMGGGFSVVMAGSDTYRAGSIEQLEEHGRRLGVKVIKHQYGADAAAVAFDAVSHARASGVDVVLVDTAGRMQTNQNLMDEMRKITRVANTDLTIFVGDALTGNDVVAQAEEFCRHVELSGSILTKIDAHAKGGSAISVAYVTRKPILYFGVGQRYEDLVPFEPEFILSRLFD